jgi:imidazolonepropionase-like amidohydrolase
MASGGMFTPGTDVMGTQFSADEMHLLVELAHDAGLPITAHAHSLAALEHSQVMAVGRSRDEDQQPGSALTAVCTAYAT